MLPGLAQSVVCPPRTELPPVSHRKAAADPAAGQPPTALRRERQQLLPGDEENQRISFPLH